MTMTGLIGGGVIHQQWPTSTRNSRENTNK
jgi:hypothetical protein